MKEGENIGVYGLDNQENRDKRGVRTGNQYKCEFRVKRST